MPQYDGTETLQYLDQNQRVNFGRTPGHSISSSGRFPRGRRNVIMYSATDSSPPQELSKEEAGSPDKDEALCTEHATVIIVHPPHLCMNLADWMLRYSKS